MFEAKASLTKESLQAADPQSRSWLTVERVDALIAENHAKDAEIAALESALTHARGPLATILAFESEARAVPRERLIELVTQSLKWIGSDNPPSVSAELARANERIAELESEHRTDFAAIYVLKTKLTKVEAERDEALAAVEITVKQHGELQTQLTEAEAVLRDLDMRATTLLHGGLVPSDFAREVQKASRACFAAKEKADAAK